MGIFVFYYIQVRILIEKKNMFFLILGDNFDYRVYWFNADVLRYRRKTCEIQEISFSWRARLSNFLMSSAHQDKGVADALLLWLNTRNLRQLN